jgi:hypothetical protein
MAGARSRTQGLPNERAPVNIDESVKRLGALIHTIHDEKAPSSDAHLSGKYLSQRFVLGPITLWGAQADEFTACVAAIYESAISKREHISLSATESLIQIAMVQSLDLDTNRPRPHLPFHKRLADSLEVLKKALSRTPPKWTVYHEVRGLMPDGLPYSVGGVEFLVIDDAQAAALVASTGPIVDGTLNTQEQKGDMRELTRDLIESRMKRKTYAKLTIEALEYNAASSLATKKLRSAIDVINFFADVLGSAGTCMFLPGDTEPTHQVSLMFQESAESASQIRTIGPLAPLYLGHINEARARSIGFDRASSLLGKDGRNALENRILTSLQWAGRAVDETRHEEAFLLYVIALESLLLIKDQTTEMRFRFALNGSHLLADKFEDRRGIFNELRDAYDKRSQIVHSGSTQVAITELSRIHALTRNAVLTVLLNEPFRNMDQFENWLKDQALGGKSES